MAKSKPNIVYVDDVQVKGTQIYTDAVEINSFGKSALVRMGNSPTLSVNRPPAAVIDCTGFVCFNFSGAGLYLLNSSTIDTVANLVFLNSCGFGNITISLDSGGLVGGLPVYDLRTGQFVEFQYDGQNLS